MQQPPSMLEQLRKLLSPKDAAKLASLVVREKTMPERTARQLGAGADWERTQQVMQSPAADSALRVLGGKPKAGVYYPSTTIIGDIMQTAAKQLSPQQMQWAAKKLTDLTQYGMYNPVTNRVAFPRGLPSGQERKAALFVKSQQLAKEEGERLPERLTKASAETFGQLTRARMASSPDTTSLKTQWAAQTAGRRGTPGEQFDRYAQSFERAYDFLVNTAQTPAVSWKDAQALGNTLETFDAPRQVKRLLEDPLFAGHPLRRAGNRP